MLRLLEERGGLRVPIEAASFVGSVRERLSTILQRTVIQMITGLYTGCIVLSWGSTRGSYDHKSATLFLFEKAFTV